jgi:hypothetical protein
VRLHRELLAIAGVTATIVGASVLAWSVVDDQASNPVSRPAAPATAADTNTGEAAAVDGCPSEAEMERYWEQNGRDLKPLPMCNDVWDADDPLPSDAPTAPEADGGHVDTPTTLAEAQAMYDPEDDPYIVIQQRPDGIFGSTHVDFIDRPPDWVKTIDDARRWFEQLEARSRRGGQ